MLYEVFLSGNFVRKKAGQRGRGVVVYERVRLKSKL